MSLFTSGYSRCWMVRLALEELMEQNLALAGPHPLYDMYTAAISEKVELLGHGMVWDYVDKIGYCWVKEEDDARYLKDEWDKFVRWLRVDPKPNVMPKTPFN